MVCLPCKCSVAHPVVMGESEKQLLEWWAEMGMARERETTQKCKLTKVAPLLSSLHPKDRELGSRKEWLKQIQCFGAESLQSQNLHKWSMRILLFSNHSHTEKWLEASWYVPNFQTRRRWNIRSARPSISAQEIPPRAARSSRSSRVSTPLMYPTFKGAAWCLWIEQVWGRGLEGKLRTVFTLTFNVNLSCWNVGINAFCQ